MKQHLKKYEFKPKYTQEDMDLIREMISSGQGDNDVMYVLMNRRPDVSTITLGRWIDSVKKE